MRLVRLVLPYVLIVVLTAGVTYAFLKNDWGVSVLLFVSSDESKVEQLLKHTPCWDDQAAFSCWDSYYEKITALYGPRVALFDLKGRYEAVDAGGEDAPQVNYPRLYCHTLLHPIGEAAGAHYGSVAEAYKHGDPFCRSGYYHGVLEGIFGEEGDDALLSNLDTICEGVPGRERYSYDYFACVHGVGHGLMSYFDHDLFESLKGCERLVGEWEQESCFGGVFMENIIADTPEERSRFLKHDDLLYPCTVVAPHQQEQCYQMQTSHAIAELEGDFARVFQLCASVEERNRIFCYQSIGRDASGWAYGSVEEVLSFCSQGSSIAARTECLVGAAADFIQSNGLEEARMLCRAAPRESVGRCLENTEAQVRML